MTDFNKSFRDPGISRRLAETLSGYSGRQANIMEVCGTHTMSIFRYGIRDILPPSIRLVSGPGCPVCVTPSSFIDDAVGISLLEGVITCTFGDLMRVPGSGRVKASGGTGAASLAGAKSEGADVRIVYSPLDALTVAAENPKSKVVFLSVGFETTAPVAALAAVKAFEGGLRNFTILSANKTMPEALKLLCSDSASSIGGFLYPGHVSAIIGTGIYEQVAEEYGIPGVVTGFEPVDIMHALVTLSGLIHTGQAKVVNEYSRVVRKEGNPLALETLFEVFEPCGSDWRGLGHIPGSGLAMREKYSSLDAWKVFGVAPSAAVEPAGCRCGEVLKGMVTPEECGLFRRICNPDSPVGACMVSSEGTCAAYYRYKTNDFDFDIQENGNV